jgi:type I restriction enzyme S subunit
LYKKTNRIGGKGIGIQGLSSNALHSLLFPLPPLAEQERIVNRIEEITPYTDNFFTLSERLNNLDALFPELLKKSVLQEAIKGALVPQNTTDEPASILIERIRNEKQKLIKKGELKKEKHESVIIRRDNSYYEISNKKERCIDEEIPFEIPYSWSWARIESLFQINPRNNIPDETIVGFMPMSHIKAGFTNSFEYEEKLWKDVKSGFTHFADNDIIIAKISPCFQNRKSAIVHNLPSGYGAGTTELHVLRDCTNLLYMPFFLLIFKSCYFIQSGTKEFTGTAGQQRIGKNFMSKYLVPVPPYLEQKRIVKKMGDCIIKFNRF